MSKKQNKRNTKKFRKNVKKRNSILKSKLESTQIGYKNRMVDFTSINIPTTVEEFRDNLLKYYFSIGRRLYVNELGYVDVDEINSMKDISDMMWDKYGEEQFQITPLVIQTKSWKSFSEKFVGDYISKGIGYVCMKWWLNPNNNIIYERNLKTEDSPMEGFQFLSQKYGDGQLYWKTYNEYGGKGDNFIEFYVKTLGEFGVNPTKSIIEEEQNQLV
ncbi:hypothetical protein [Polaribacter sp.]|uniref:hypothetical protein n=1 Tax=Polaribacter sp. TaxID=1920175 RepID=UPI003F696914